MQIFKTFLKIALKNIASGIIFVFMFLGISFVTANSSSMSSRTDFTTKKINIAIVDQDNSTLSHGLADYIGGVHNVVEIASDETLWPDELFYHSVEGILVIEKGFQQNIQNQEDNSSVIFYKNPDSSSAFIVSSQADAYLNYLRTYINVGYSLSEAVQSTNQVASITASTGYLDASIVTAKPVKMSFFFTFLPYIMTATLISSLGPMLLIWNRPELKARNAISSLSLRKRNVALIAATGAYAGIVFLIFMGITAAVYVEDFFTMRGLYYVLNAFVYLLVCVAITYLVAQLSKKHSSLTMYSNVIGLGSAFLCGVFVSRTLLPDSVNAFAKCLPAYWYINISDELAYFDGSLSKLAYQSFAIQILFTMAIFAVALALVKSRQRKVD